MQLDRLFALPVGGAKATRRLTSLRRISLHVSRKAMIAAIAFFNLIFMTAVAVKVDRVSNQLAIACVLFILEIALISFAS